MWLFKDKNYALRPKKKKKGTGAVYVLESNGYFYSKTLQSKHKIHPLQMRKLKL